MEKITVILPVYNGDNYLESSIKSVLGQSFEDFTLRVLDDGSSDRTAEIAQSISDPRVRYSTNPDRLGLFKTLNRGFTEAKSELVRIWAHDDVMLPDSLLGFYETAMASPASGMLYCDFYAIDGRGRRTGQEERYAHQRARTPDVAGATTSAALFFCFGCLPGNISTVMLRRTAWEKIGGFTEGIQQAPDYEMWVRISDRYDVTFIRQKLIELRDHPLQLARMGQKQMTTIAEEFPIFQELQRRLGGLLTGDKFARFWHIHRGRQHLHWVVRAVLRGDFDAAGRGWRALSRYGAPWQQLVFWLISGNGRFFTQKPEAFYDELLKQIEKNTHGQMTGSLAD